MCAHPGWGHGASAETIRRLFSAFCNKCSWTPRGQISERKTCETGSRPQRLPASVRKLIAGMVLYL